MLLDSDRGHCTVYSFDLRSLIEIVIALDTMLTMAHNGDARGTGLDPREQDLLEQILREQHERTQQLQSLLTSNSLANSGATLSAGGSSLLPMQFQLGVAPIVHDPVLLLLHQQNLQRLQGQLYPVSVASLPSPASAPLLPTTASTTISQANRPGLAFPEKLHQLLLDCERNNQMHIISFVADGQAFDIHDETAFLNEVAPRYFKVTSLSSFQRQLYLYGFSKFRDPGAKHSQGYAHPNFLRDRPDMLPTIRRSYKKRPPS